MNVSKLTKIYYFNISNNFFISIFVFVAGAEFSDWSAWTICDKPCGSGSKTRRRTCMKKEEGDCQGITEETSTCKIMKCKG